MTPDPHQTIAALASAPGPSVRGIIRISGPYSRDVLASVFQPDPSSASWQAARRPCRWTGFLLVDAIQAPVPVAVNFWPDHRSYTGQVMAELHVPGCEPILEAILDHLCRHGARMAQRGEFTMRAFLSGRIDLLQAEAVLGVIEAADHEELQVALSQLGGNLTHRLREIRSDLIANLGDLEAGLDFVDEDIEFITTEQIVDRLKQSIAILNTLNTDADTRLPAGYRRRIVLAGLPNAGKSTLFNRLAGSETAIVSPVAGTTRDYVSTVIRLNDLPVELIDTAGWEHSSDSIMQSAQELREGQVQAADLVLWCRAADLSPKDRILDHELRMKLPRECDRILPVETRCDLAESASEPTTGLRVSATTGAGIADLKSHLSRILCNSGLSRGELLGTTAVRCRDSLRRASESLGRAVDVAMSQTGHELIAFEIRLAQRELAEILGEVYTDDLLDHIFSRFCIGK